MPSSFSMTDGDRQQETDTALARKKNGSLQKSFIGPTRLETLPYSSKPSMPENLAILAHS